MRKENDMGSFKFNDIHKAYAWMRRRARLGNPHCKVLLSIMEGLLFARLDSEDGVVMVMTPGKEGVERIKPGTKKGEGG